MGRDARHDSAGGPAPVRPEAVVFCGIQGTGKTTFYRTRFRDTHGRVNLDELRTRHRERELLTAYLTAGRSFVVDNTNPTAAERAVYVAPALAHGFRAIAFWVEALPRQAIARNATRDGRERIPVPGILGTRKRLEPPSFAEGFEEVFRVRSEDGERFVVDALEAPRHRIAEDR